MKKAIPGEKYIFHIITSKGRFYIETLHKANMRYSSINNLNPILSAFEIDIDDPRFWNSKWEVSKRRCKFLFRRAVDFLSDKNFRRYVENILDEDRQLGEWENRKTPIV